MSTREPETDPFINALREDLPTERDQARIRARLLAASVIASTGLAPGVAAGGTVAGGLVPKLLTLPMFAKVGLAATVVGLSAVPVARYTARSDEKPQTVASSVRAHAPARPAPLAAVPATDTEVIAATESVALEPVPKQLPRERARSLPEFSRAPNTAGKTAPAVAGPSVGSFDAPAAPLDEGTLRAETALIEAALSAIRTGDAPRARGLLAEHAAQFPNGLLVRERERALALTLLSDTTQGAASVP